MRAPTIAHPAAHPTRRLATIASVVTETRQRLARLNEEDISPLRVFIVATEIARLEILHAMRAQGVTVPDAWLTWARHVPSLKPSRSRAVTPGDAAQGRH
jgi:hypothetical protein